MGTKHSMSLNSSHLIELRNFHYPFVLSCTTTNLSSTSSPTQTTNDALVSSSILTNHTPPTSSPYQPLALRVNVGSQSYIFPNPLNHAQLGHFFPPTLLVPITIHDHSPQPTPIFSTCFQHPPKTLCPTYGRQVTSRWLTRYQHFCQTSNSSDPNSCDHLGSIPSFTSTSFA
jgi:hypothetical protein